MEDFNHIKTWLLGDPEAKNPDKKAGLLTLRGLSVEQLGRQAGITRAALYHYISDARRPSTEVMRRICDALGVDREEGLSQYTPRAVGRPKGYKP